MEEEGMDVDDAPLGLYAFDELSDREEKDAACDRLDDRDDRTIETKRDDILVEIELASADAVVESDRREGHAAPELSVEELSGEAPDVQQERSMNESLRDRFCTDSSPVVDPRETEEREIAQDPSDNGPEDAPIDIDPNESPIGIEDEDSVEEKECRVDVREDVDANRSENEGASADETEEEKCVLIDADTQTGASLQAESHPGRSLMPIATSRAKGPIDDVVSTSTSPTSSPDVRSPETCKVKGQTPDRVSENGAAQEVVTYRRALERIKAIEEEEHQRLYLKKNWLTALTLRWRRWRKAFHFSLWSDRIQAVEGKHGSNVGLTMYFLRWTVYMNLLISALWIAFTVLPFIAYPPETFSWDVFAERNATEFINGDALGSTWFLYGGYQYPVDVTHGGVYEPGIVFPLAAVLMLFGSLISLLSVIGKRISGDGDSSVIEQNQTYPFSSVVFASWDFHIKDPDAVKNLKNAICSQIREMVHDAEWNQKTTTLQEQLLTGTTKLVGTLVLWPIIVCMTAAAMFYAIEKGDAINDYFGFSFAQSITITLVSLAGQVLVRSTVKYEGWHPRIAQQVEATKLFSVKMINLAVILYKMYDIQQQAAAAMDSLTAHGVEQLPSCDVGDAQACPIASTCCDSPDCIPGFDPSFLGRCVPICEENEMGLIFYRLVVTNGFILLFQEIFVALFMSKCLKKPPSLDATKFFINIIDTQASPSLQRGSIVAPLLPLFGIASNVANFFVKTWLAKKIYDPPVTTCSAARNSNMQYNLTLLTLLLSALPVTSFVYEERDICGPNTGQSMADALSRRIRRAPSFVKTLIRWVTNPIVLGGMLFVVAFFFMLERVRRNKWQRKANESRTEFTRYRHDMHLKMRETRSRTASPYSVNAQRPLPTMPQT